MEEPVVLVFENINQLVKGLSEHFMKLLKSSQGIFNLALSGGNTPKAWFEDLAKNHANDIDWNKVHIFWGDERCVPPEDMESNFGMTKTFLLDHISIPSQNIHRIHGELNPEEEAEWYERELMENFSGNNYPVFDLIILGMGEDGHTASIFPYQIDLWKSDKFCVAAAHPATGQQRISLTGKVINNAKSVVFLITGEKKAVKIKEIIYGEPAASAYPASMVNPVNGQLFWFLDKQAASQLTYDK